jgi:hypothetical protein
MERGILYAITRPSSPEREGEYHRWYNEQHLADILTCDGYRLARRYEAVGTPVLGQGVEPTTDEGFVAIYEIEAEDLSAAVENMLSQVQSGAIPLSDALGTDPPPQMILFRELAEVVK